MMEIFSTSPGFAVSMKSGPVAGSPRAKSNVAIEEAVDVGVIWLWPPSRRGRVMVPPGESVWMGFTERFHFRWMW